MTFVACDCGPTNQKICYRCKGSGLVEAMKVGDRVVPFPPKFRSHAARVKRPKLTVARRKAVH